MDNFISTLLYIILLIAIVLVGGISKRKKKPVPMSGGGTQKPTSSGSPVLDAILKGTGLTDVLMEKDPDFPDQENRFDEPESEPVIDEKDEEDEQPWLTGEEGVPVFNQQREQAVSEITLDESLTQNIYAHDHEKAWLESVSRPPGYLNELLKDFDARKAIIYAEIMNTKYF
ncbi:MAG: hypothetical protein GXO83_01150 [Chlorobi bacterium]|nr:hypothetical protein [Chlorobiota bacterium]